MLLVVDLDLSDADFQAFEDYEDRVLALLPEFGATLRERLRSLDNGREFHLIEFPNEEEFSRFMGDSRRKALAPMQKQGNASTTIYNVRRLSSG